MVERGIILLCTAILGIAVLGPFWVGDDALATSAQAALLHPSWTHPFGTDPLGRDVLARVVSAARLDLGLAAAGTALALTLGGAVGAVIGWYGGWADRFGSWLIDLLMALPIYLSAMVLAGAVGNSLLIIVLVTGMVNLPIYIRLVRSEVAKLRCSPLIDALRMGGAGGPEILRRAILPIVMPLLVVQASTTFGLAILNAAGLSFIGIGVRPPTAEWGIMISEGAGVMLQGAWWVALFPAAALVATVMSCHLAGEALRRRLAADSQ